MSNAIRVLGLGLAEKAQTTALAERCYATAYEALQRDDDASAAKLFAIFALLSPRDARAWVGLSVCCERSGLHEAAAGLYGVGSELATEDTHFCHLGRARALERLGRLDAAQDAYDEANFATPHGNPARTRSSRSLT
jgi:predicted TPR repeat methyltransferase